MAEKPPAFVVVDKRKFTAEGEIREGFIPPPELPREPIAAAPVESAAPESEDWSSAKVVTMPTRMPQAAENQTANTNTDTDTEAADDLGDEDMVGTVKPFPRVEQRAAGLDGNAPANEDDLAELNSEIDEELSAQEQIGQPRSAAETAAQHAAYKESTREIDKLLQEANPGMQPEGAVGFEHVIQSFYLSAIMAMGAGTQPGQQPRIDIVGARQAIDMLSVLEDKTSGNISNQEQQLLQGITFELRMMFLELTNAISKQAHQPPPPGGFSPGGGLR